MSAEYVKTQSGLVVPRHVAFIMDGNRTWAQENGFKNSIEGHRHGVDIIPPLVEHAITKGIKMVTFWALSPDNLQRSEPEVNNLMQVFNEALDREDIIGRLINKGSKINFIGEIHILDTLLPGISMKIDGIRKRSEHNHTITVTVALNYGGEQEILRAFRLSNADGYTNMDGKLLRKYLYMPDDVDLVIRSGGQERSSGFMPIQSAYAEWYRTKTLWPDFTPDDFDKALIEFANRKRNFGK